MFPSLCFIDPSSANFGTKSTELLEDNMSEESFTVITETAKPDISFKFKIVELFSTNNLFSAKK